MSFSHSGASEALGDADSDDHPAPTQTIELSASSTTVTGADSPISSTHNPRDLAMPAKDTASSTFKDFVSARGYGDLPDGERRAVEELYNMYVSSANEDAPGEATKDQGGADDGKDRVGTDRREAEASVNSYPSDDSDDSGGYIIPADGELDCWGTQPPSKQEGQASPGEGAMTPDCALGGMYGTVKSPAGSVSGSDYGLIRIDAESPPKIISKVKGPTNVYDVLALLEAERERIRHSEGAHLLPDDH